MAIGDWGNEFVKYLQSVVGGGQQPQTAPATQQTAPLGGNVTTIPQQVAPTQQTPAAAPAATQDTSSSIPPEIYQMAQAMRPPTTGVAGFLNNPLVQGALSAYLSGISSPRVMGWGGALGRGGLAGLQAFSAAEKAQDDDLTKAAGVWKDVQTGKASEIGAEKTAAELKQIQQIPIINKRNADYLRTQGNQQKDPEVKQAYFDAANMVEADDNKVFSVNDMSTLVGNIYANRKTQAETVTELGKPGLQEAQKAAAYSEVTRNQASAAADAARANVENLQAKFDQETDPLKKQQLDLALRNAKDDALRKEQDLKTGGFKPELKPAYGPKGNVLVPVTPTLDGKPIPPPTGMTWGETPKPTGTNADRLNKSSAAYDKLHPAGAIRKGWRWVWGTGPDDKADWIAHTGTNPQTGAPLETRLPPDWKLTGVDDKTGNLLAKDSKGVVHWIN